MRGPIFVINYASLYIYELIKLQRRKMYALDGYEAASVAVWH